jgi:competence ComEA-like helix-hairpin-helix protein
LLRFGFVWILLAGCLATLCSCARLPRQYVSSEKSQSTTPITESDSFRININTASAAELEGLPGIGKALAERIVVHRERFGLFRRPEHLMMVRGISDRKFRKIRLLVTVD